jgi:hypothetical protein
LFSQETIDKMAEIMDANEDDYITPEEACQGTETIMKTVTVGDVKSAEYPQEAVQALKTAMCGLPGLKKRDFCKEPITATPSQNSTDLVKRANNGKAVAGTVTLMFGILLLTLGILTIVFGGIAWGIPIMIITGFFGILFFIVGAIGIDNGVKAPPTN